MTRAAGVPNRNKRGLKAQLKQAYGDEFDVIMMMGKNCKQLFDMIPDEPTKEDRDIIIDASTQLDRLAQYVEPKLKSIEISGDPENPLEIAAYELTTTERSARIAALLESARDRRDGAADNDECSDMESPGGATD
jgi:hypothetical protein